MAAKKDHFETIATEYGMTLPGLPEARPVKIQKSRRRYSPTGFLVAIKDMETDITTCAFTVEDCKKGLAELLLRSDQA